MITKLKFLIFLVCFFCYSLQIQAGDTIRMIAKCNGLTSNGIVATAGKKFTVNYGDGTIKTFTGTGNSQSLGYNYFSAGRYEVTISGSEDCFFLSFLSDRADTLDLSSCPSIPQYYAVGGSTLRSLNTNNCINLERIYVGGNQLTVLDLRDNIALKDLACYENQLTRIDLVSIERIMCQENRLPLSNLYTLSEMISDPWDKLLGRQEFPTQKIALGDSIDFSDQKEFGGIATVFHVDRWGLPVPPEEYQIKEGIIKFFKSSAIYRVIMTNAAIVSSPLAPAVVVASFFVIDFVPVSEIVDVPTTAIAGTPLNLKGTLVPNNATYKAIIWSVKDAGITGATITTGGTRLYTTAGGTAIITATIREGSAIGTDYTQDFCVEVLPPVGIYEPEHDAGIRVYPNPTTGEFQVTSDKLQVTSVEVFDIYGRKNITPVTCHSSLVTLNISHLSAGIYFVKIVTEQGEVVKKVVKQ